jgi:hypothetical protein
MDARVAPCTGFAVLAAALLALLPAAAAADGCRLSQVASLALTDATDGTPQIPVKIGGSAVNLVLDLNDPFSFLTSAAAAQLKLAPADSHAAPEVVFRDRAEKRGIFKGDVSVVTVPRMEIGPLIVRGQGIYSASGVSFANGISGGVGLDILGRYDVELDLAKNRLNIFDPDHCPGQVVYWTHQPVGIVDIEPMPGGTVHYNFDLDGKTIGAFVTPENPQTLLAFFTAREEFALTHASKGVVAAGTNETLGALYRYPFKALDANGLSIANPAVYLFGDENNDMVCDSKSHERGINHGYRCRGDAALKIGLHELRALHLFFDFSEKKLYVTAANAD